MKQLTFVQILIAFVTPFYAQEANETTLNDEQLATEILVKAVQQKEVIGIAAGFTVAGEITWANGAGYGDKKDKTPFEATTLTRTASIVKPMTAIAIMQLYEQGKIKLDDPLQTYISDFPSKPEGGISIRHLLSHASGIGGYQSGKDRENKVAYPNLSAAINHFKNRPLVAAPGEAFNYTTYGYVLLGRIIEVASGMSYEEYLRKNIWEKAGMKNTGVEEFGKKYSNKATLYHKNRKGKIKCEKPANLSDRIPGGGVYSTVEDLLKFGAAVLNHSLVKKETLGMMTIDSGLKKEGNGYGLGWYLYGNNSSYGQVFGHTGAQIGCSGMLMLLPDQETTVIVLSNTSGVMQTVSNIAVQLFDVAGKGVKR